MGSPFDSLKKAAQAVVGAPDLFRAATGAGATASAAADVMAASAAALQIAATSHDGVPGQQNAIRHFIWQAYISGRHGLAVAEAVAEAQEKGRTSPEDSRVDLHNNAVGRAYGAEHAAEIGRGSLTDALKALVPIAKQKFEADELIWVNDGRDAP